MSLVITLDKLPHLPSFSGGKQPQVRGRNLLPLACALLIWFGQPGAAIKGFAHESAVWNSLGGQRDLALSNLSRQIPTEFEPFLREPAFIPLLFSSENLSH
jgi:hypothetical protein